MDEAGWSGGWADGFNGPDPPGPRTGLLSFERAPATGRADRGDDGSGQGRRVDDRVGPIHRP